MKKGMINVMIMKLRLKVKLWVNQLRPKRFLLMPKLNCMTNERDRVLKSL